MDTKYCKARKARVRPESRKEGKVRLDRAVCLWEVKSQKLRTWKKTGNWVIGMVDWNICVYGEAEKLT